MTRAHLVSATFLVALAGCSDRGLPAQSPGYLSTDKCIQATTADSCGALVGCQWLAVPVAATANGGDPATGAPGGRSVCVAQDPCLGRDATACAADSACAWSTVGTLCPVNADCAAGGFCHARDDEGGSCACVSPVACPADGPCPKVECDCSGGGSGGAGGACGCACPPCAAGETCAPCACNCGEGGSGCGDVGTCACACPACAPGETCPPCDCTCGSGGGTTVTPDPTAPAPTDPPCLCDCAPCAAGADCPPCACTCGGTTDGGSVDGGTANTTTTCVPPPAPSPTPIACPAIGCFADCPSGFKTGSDGCPTCECL